MARAALSILDIITKDNLIAKAIERGAYALELLEKIRIRHIRLIPQPIRRQALTLSLDIGVNPENSKENEKLSSSIFYRCMEKGMILNYPAFGSSFTFSFPLISTEKNILDACEIFDHGLSDFDGYC